MRSVKVILLMLFIMLLSLSHSPLLYGQSKESNPPHVAKALSYVGTHEIGTSNWGGSVTEFIRFAGGNYGVPWCAAFVSYCLGTTPSIVYPRIKTLSSQGFKTSKSIDAKWVLRGKRVNDGSIVGWQKGKTYSGHVGIVKHQTGANSFTTIEGNTSPNERGSQADGGCVAIKHRSINPRANFRITYFTEVEYK